MIDVFLSFSSFSDIKPNKTKCEVTGIGILKGVDVALSGMGCINLKNKTIELLGSHYSDNKSFKIEEKFKSHIGKIERCPKALAVRNFNSAR